ncbi:hypothetical protein [Mesorhizobium sp. INR15]|uniref:hypothetical protein n=1 Tax=Mesorhizobium sp. INR15 TaxID=2654248 RepID=UPI001896469F|nr:hypothetical protein [Mesorhizobium sp. INR15]QPC92071.1 hypothetical protein GA829_16605 [Mesorhizobium sp. INR15]
MQRYEVVEEPVGTWVVLDSLDGVPAERDDRVLIGLTWHEATYAAASLETALWNDSPGRPSAA